MKRSERKKQTQLQKNNDICVSVSGCVCVHIITMAKKETIVHNLLTL